MRERVYSFQFIVHFCVLCTVPIPYHVLPLPSFHILIYFIFISHSESQKKKRWCHDPKCPLLKMQLFQLNLCNLEQFELVQAL